MVILKNTDEGTLWPTVREPKILRDGDGVVDDIQIEINHCLFVFRRAFFKLASSLDGLVFHLVVQQ